MAGSGAPDGMSDRPGAPGSAVGEFRALVEDLRARRGELGEGLLRPGAEDGGTMAVLECEPHAEVTLDRAAHRVAGHHPQQLAPGRLVRRRELIVRYRTAGIAQPLGQVTD